MFAMFLLALISSLFEWVAVAKGWRRLEYFAKPAVMLFLLAWMLLAGGLDHFNLRWFIIGAFFSLLGDVALLLPRERLGFMLGLTFFLLAHISYIIAINSPLPPVGVYLLLVALVPLSLALWMGHHLVQSLLRKGPRRLILPVGLYIIVLASMLYGALCLNFHPSWDTIPAALVSIGAALFALSDGILSWNKFVRPMRYGRLFLMITYHLAQFAILGGAFLQFAK